MGVLSCNRYGCSDIMCERYSYNYGYICRECFDELIESNEEIEEFMNIRKNRDGESIRNRIEMLNNEFVKDE